MATQTALSARLDALHQSHIAGLIDDDEYRFLRKQAFIHLVPPSTANAPPVLSDTPPDSSSSTDNRRSSRLIKPSSPGSPPSSYRRAHNPSPSRSHSSPIPTASKTDRPAPVTHSKSQSSFLTVPGSSTAWQTSTSSSGQGSGGDDGGPSPSSKELKALRRRSLTAWIGVGRETGEEGQGESKIKRSKSGVLGLVHRRDGRSPSPGALDERKSAKRRSWLQGDDSHNIPADSSFLLSSSTPSPSKPKSTSLSKSSAPSKASSSSPFKSSNSSAPLTLQEILASEDLQVLQAELTRLEAERVSVRKAYEEVEEGLWKEVGLAGRDFMPTRYLQGNGNGNCFGDGGIVSAGSGWSNSTTSADAKKPSLASRTRTKVWDVFRRVEDAGAGRGASTGKKAAVKETKGSSWSSAGFDGAMSGLGFRKTVVNVARAPPPPPPPAMDGGADLGRYNSGSTNGGISPVHSRMISSPTTGTSSTFQNPYTHGHSRRAPSSRTMSHHPPSATSLSTAQQSVMHSQAEKEREELEQRMERLEKLKEWKDECAKRYGERIDWVGARMKTIELQRRART